MRLPQDRTLISGILIFCFICCFLFQICIEIGLENQQQPGAVSLDADEPRTPNLGVVVPLRAEEIHSAVDSIKRWPTTCSGITLKSVDLIFYFAREIPQELERHLRRASDAISCFRKTRVVTAALRPEECSDQFMRNAQFYKLFVSPEVRASFVDYDAIAMLEWDIIVAQGRSFEGLYLGAFTGSEPFWVKGSRLAGVNFDENAASPDVRYLLDHLDGNNAIYNNRDNDFVEFVSFTLDRWQFTRPFDVALWAMISYVPYSWPLWQGYASKFVATSMVAMIDTRDEENGMATDKIAPEALFFRRQVSSMATRLETVARQEEGSFGCREACGLRTRTIMAEAGGVVSTVCDSTCVESHVGIGIRFNGHNCGAGNLSKYGESCRLCYEDRIAALVAEQPLVTSNGNPWKPDDHVIMCGTRRPPEAIDCPRECSDKINTICDYRCGTGRYGDWHCGWRNFGEKCRFCFRDIAEAQRADLIAREAGGRVIMCETHEPPPEGHDTKTVVGSRNIVPIVELGSMEEVSSTDKKDKKEPPQDFNSSGIPFIGDVRRGNICIFTSGYFDFFHETRLLVETIMEFMPGVKVAVATHPMDYHVYNRALGEPNAAVSIVNNTRVEYASLAADEACGDEIRLIYYMNPGEVLSRPFTAQDTHSPKGDLLVKHTDAESAGGEHARRCMGSAALLGFYGPSFTYGTDLILPVEANTRLRAVLWDAFGEYGLTRKVEGCEQEDSATCAFHELLDLMSSVHATDASIFIPELLAALLYESNPEEVQFVDSRNRRHHSSVESTIWDAPFVTRRFGCSTDLSPTLQGYDVADQLSKHVEAFRNGARCDHGFVPVDPSTLKLKAEWEFPKGYPSSRMPSLRDFRISVMYRTFSGDLEIFNFTLPKTIKHIRDALELVVVVEEADKDLFEELLAPHHQLVPFPIRLVVEPSLMNGNIQQKYSKMRADLYTEGDYVLHLDSDVLVLYDVTYDHIFHLGKPVLPFRRHRDDSREGRGLISCWKNATAHAVGEDVVHEFSIFNTHVYPRQMYQALRSFVEKLHGKSFQDYMSTRIGRCQSPSKWPAEKRNRLLSDFNLMGAFLWYHMPEAVYWMPADPYDMRPNQFRVDLLRYSWVCQANGRFLPGDAAGKKQFKDNFLSVTNTQHCNAVVLQWRKRSMKNPETRTQISREGW